MKYTIDAHVISSDTPNRIITDSLKEIETFLDEQRPYSITIRRVHLKNPDELQQFIAMLSNIRLCWTIV